MKIKTIIAVAIAAFLALGAVVATSDDSSATGWTVSAEDHEGGALTVDADGIHGTVKNGSALPTETYTIDITITAGNGYISYIAGGAFQSEPTVDGALTIDGVPVTEDTLSFDFAITAGPQTSLSGLVLNSVPLDLTFDDGSPKTITWTVDGIVIGSTDTTDRAIPVAPSKEHYVLAGWAVDGVLTITYNSGLDGDGYRLAEGAGTVDAYLGALTEDTVFTAVFEPVIHTVTLVAGESTVGTITAPYGTTIVEPRLPEGFKAWDFDFTTPITGDITIVAVEADPIAPVTVYDVTFEIEGKAPVTQKSDSLVGPDTTREGYAFQGWVVKGGAEYVDPTTYTITQDITFVAVYKTATETTYTVTFEIEGKSIITQKADSLAIPDTTREGYTFQGWVVKGGSSAYVDPLTYEITSDITFVAVYKAVEVIEHTVTFVNGEAVVGTVKVIDGEKITTTPEAPEGLFWLYDKDAAVTEDITVEAKPITVKVEFKVGDKIFSAYTQTVPYGESIDTNALSDFVFPEGFDSWDADLTAPVYEDTVILAKAIPAPVEEPGFLSTPTGQCAIILAVFVIGALVTVAYTKGLIKVPSRKAKTEVPAAPAETVTTEPAQEEKK